MKHYPYIFIYLWFISIVISIMFLAGRVGTTEMTFALTMMGFPFVISDPIKKKEIQKDPERTEAEKLAWEEINSIEKEAGL